MRPAALVTGAAARIGRNIALTLAAKGYDIALHYRHSKKEAESTAEAAAAKGVVCRLFQADLADAAQCAPLIEQVKAVFPPLSVLVNNASVFDKAGFLESDETFFRSQFRINFEAPVFLTQAFARHVKQGVVVNMLDTYVTHDKHNHFYYLLSKKALLDFTRMAAAELAPGIRVNGIAPGYALPAPGWDEEYRKQLEARLPMQKTVTPEEVAQAVYTLVAAPSLTGQILFVDGGQSLL